MNEIFYHEEEIKLLRQLARKAKDSRMRTRYDAVRLHLEGRPYSETAEILNLTYHTVRNYVIAYRESGVDGLSIKPKPGRTRKLTDAQERQLHDCVSQKLPREEGFEPFVNWTAPLACEWVKRKFGVEFSERGMRDVFYRLNLSHTRPTYTLKKADPKKQEAFKADFEGIKKTVVRRG